MNSKLKIGIFIGLGIALMIFNTPVMGVLALAAWIYLLVMLIKKKTDISGDETDTKLAEKRIKWFKALLITAGITFPVSIVAIILHNLQENSHSDFAGIFSFFTGIIFLYIFILATAGSLLIFLKGRQII